VFKRILMLAVAAVVLSTAVGCGRHRCCRDNATSFAPPPPPLPCDNCPPLTR
jgi:hypothetical protein